MRPEDVTMREREIRAILRTLSERGLTLATAESLTGGAVCSRLVEIPGASEAVLGGVCTYATPLKETILGVDGARLAEAGPVDALVAQQMARGAQRLFNARVGVATTGVAGPGPSDGHPAGTVYVACAIDEQIHHRQCHFDGERNAVREHAVTAALTLLADCLQHTGGGHSSHSDADRTPPDRRLHLPDDE